MSGPEVRRLAVGLELRDLGLSLHLRPFRFLLHRRVSFSVISRAVRTLTLPLACDSVLNSGGESLCFQKARVESEWFRLAYSDLPECWVEGIE